MESDFAVSCPLGKVCEDIDLKHRCLWFMEFTTTTAAGEIFKTKQCAMTWLPILQIEMIQAVKAIGVEKKKDA